MITCAPISCIGCSTPCATLTICELAFIIERYAQPWATQMSELLIEIKTTVDQVHVTQDHLAPDQLIAFELRYDAILEQGFRENPLPPAKARRRTCWIGSASTNAKLWPSCTIFACRLITTKPSETCA